MRGEWLGLAALLLAGGGLEDAIAEDLIDLRQLGKRGAILGTAYSGQRPEIWDVRLLGDFDGDGLDDLGVIYKSDPDETMLPYRVTIVYGQRELWGQHILEELPRKTVFQVDNSFIPAGKGRPNHVHPAGDVNGDGLDDFLVGYVSYRLAADQESRGAAFLVYGHRDLIGEGFIEEVSETVPGVVFFSSDPRHDSVGSNYANIGDFNGDGRDDLAISAPVAFIDHVEGERGGVLFVLFDTQDLPPRVDLAKVGEVKPFRAHVGLDGSLSSLSSVPSPSRSEVTG
jgi:hypothetical protein